MCSAGGRSSPALLPPLSLTHTSLLPQVLLKWNVQRGVGVIPKASSEARLRENSEGLFTWRLTWDQKVWANKGLFFLEQYHIWHLKWMGVKLAG